MNPVHFDIVRKTKKEKMEYLTSLTGYIGTAVECGASAAQAVGNAAVSVGKVVDLAGKTVRGTAAGIRGSYKVARVVGNGGIVLCGLVKKVVVEYVDPSGRWVAREVSVVSEHLRTQKPHNDESGVEFEEQSDFVLITEENGDIHFQVVSSLNVPEDEAISHSATTTVSGLGLGENVLEEWNRLHPSSDSCGGSCDDSGDDKIVQEIPEGFLYVISSTPTQ